VDLDETATGESGADQEGFGDYCRHIESYLCRKNDGHLIRIVGPSFEKVCGWAEQGVPIKVVFRGIDRYFERYYAKGPRRRPVRIDFCEADVLDVFDEWRRAVGVAPSDVRPERRETLPAHLDRVVRRLNGRVKTNSRLDPVIDPIVRELESARESTAFRGAARAALLDRLRELDRSLLAAARALLPDAELERLRGEAEQDLAHYRDRMPEAAYQESVSACMDRLLRERENLPTLALE
jgi:hypothetical protein